MLQWGKRHGGKPGSPGQPGAARRNGPGSSSSVEDLAVACQDLACLRWRESQHPHPLLVAPLLSRPVASSVFHRLNGRQDAFQRLGRHRKRRQWAPSCLTCLSREPAVRDSRALPDSTFTLAQAAALAVEIDASDQPPYINKVAATLNLAHKFFTATVSWWSAVACDTVRWRRNGSMMPSIPRVPFSTSRAAT